MMSYSNSIALRADTLMQLMPTIEIKQSTMMFTQSAADTVLFSKLVENIFAALIARAFKTRYYFMGNTKKVDFVIHDSTNRFGIEIKYQNKIISEDLKGLSLLGNGILITKNTLDIRDRIVMLPTSLATLML